MFELTRVVVYTLLWTAAPTKWLRCGLECSADLMSFLIGLGGEISQEKKKKATTKLIHVYI